MAGDLITAKPAKFLKPAIELLKALTAEFPVYYGNGSHEYRLKRYPKTYADIAGDYGQSLADMGIFPLVRRAAGIRTDGVGAGNRQNLLQAWSERLFNPGELWAVDFAPERTDAGQET